MEEQFRCLGCGESKNADSKNYFKSYDKTNALGIIPYCKTCLNKMVLNSNGVLEEAKLKETLKLINRPFIRKVWETSKESDGKSFGVYMKNLGLKQYRELTWQDSEFDDKNNNANQTINSKIISSDVDIEALEDKWGSGYSIEEYSAFEKKWKKLIDNYGEKTALHIEGLTTYIRFRVKEEMATAKGEVKEAKEWASMAKDAATNAKINVSQLSKSDISGGVDLLPQLFEAVESEIGIIPILPYLKAQPYDDVDLIIWSVVNYIRRLEDKSRVAYSDIWNFYDEMLGEHYKQKGFSQEDIKKEKEKRNNVFRDLGQVYKEPVYEESDN